MFQDVCLPFSAGEKVVFELQCFLYFDSANVYEARIWEDAD